MTVAHKMEDIDITATLIAEQGLNPDEYDLLVKQLGRTPNVVELAIVGAMWSEHCSYKSSKKWLKTLPIEAPWVIQGPGENAGVIDIGDGQAAVFKIESHNSPSRIEPFQGAATGVGGILRDIFTMGARPIANLNALRFGDPSHANTRHLVSGVVSGIGFYGNCVGVPTIAGECEFGSAYNENCLVNAMTVGLASTDKIFYCAAAGVGNPIVYVGSKTGRDGIGGATMSSEGFDDDIDQKRPTVQVGDPFTEKLLIEACLELMAEDAIIAIQDMGAVGLTSSITEMASKGKVGVELWIDKIPAREENMTAYDFMLSESQERMLMVLKPGSEDKARAIFKKWALDFAIIGVVTETNHLILKEGDQIVADLPVTITVDSAPEYDRPWEPTTPQSPIDTADISIPTDLGQTLLQLMASPNMASRRWIWEQYDHMVMGDTHVFPGNDAGVVRIHNSNRGLAMATDCTPRYVKADPVTGGKQAVAESYRNLSSVGAKPLAITNNLNFGNPEQPAIMGQLVGAVHGMREACKALEYPVVSGNVSLYNETRGEAILPTPVIGGVGLIENLNHSMTLSFKSAGEDILMVGKTQGWLGCSRYLEVIEGREEGAPPPVDLLEEKKNADFVRTLIEQGLVTAAHDISDGGLICALSEMAMAPNIGATLNIPDDIPAHAFLFGEDQARFVLTTTDLNKIQILADKEGVTLARMGQTTADATLTFADTSVPLNALKIAHEEWLPTYMDGQ